MCFTGFQENKIPFLKDHDKSSHDLSNSRPSSLLNSPMKIHDAIICKRLNNFFEVNNIISHFQAAYRRNLSAADHNLTLQKIFLENRYNKISPRGGRIKKLHDLKTALDTAPRHLLFPKKINAGTREKLFRVIKNLFSSNPANVLFDSFLSPAFHINQGVLRGSKLGPLLFNLSINDLLESSNNSNRATIGDILVSALGFADDIVPVTDCQKKAQKLLDIFQSWAFVNTTTFKTSKCEVMVINGRSSDVKLMLYSDTRKIVDSYRYLGVTLTSNRITNLFRTHFNLVID